MGKQFLHMQKLAGLITESEYKQKLNENKFQLGQTVDFPEGTAEIIQISSYLDNEDEIDRSISETGWESSTPKENLIWYKLEPNEYGDINWYDEEELEAYN